MVCNALYRDKVCFLCASTGSEHKNMGAGGTSGTSLSSLFYLPTSWYLWLEGKMTTFKFFLNCIFIVHLAYNEMVLLHEKFLCSSATLIGIEKDQTMHSAMPYRKTVHWYLFSSFLLRKKKPAENKRKANTGKHWHSQIQYVYNYFIH